jgi:activator of HSP90 ATPase
MTKPIIQSVTFSASPTVLFQMYTDSQQHSAATGSRAVVSSKVGAEFNAFEGMLSGRNLVIVPNRLIVQAWRASHWKKADLDSILVLTFTKAAGGARVDLVHTGVPQHDHKGVRLGWPKYYWKPWRSYLKKRAASR